MENALRCLVEVLARGTNSWPVTEERRALFNALSSSLTFQLYTVKCYCISQ